MKGSDATNPHRESQMEDTASKLSTAVTGKLQIPSSKANFAEQMLADSRVLRIIMRQIAQETDFLLEVKLMNLLKPYIIEEKRNIIEIDNVFRVRKLQF